MSIQGTTDDGPPVPDAMAVANLVSDDGPVGSPAGIVYSTSPRIATMHDGTVVYVKGPDAATVFAEVTGCRLAEAVGLSVPRTVLCTMGDGLVLAGSVEAATVGRDVAPWLAAPERCANHQELFAAVVVDAWLANTDRNMGNVLVSNGAGKKDHFLFIDFEKCKTLRQFPRVESASAAPASLWPSEQLGLHLRASKPVTPPTATMTRITDLVRDADAVGKLVYPVASHVPVDWVESTIETVIDRGFRISAIVGEVWQQS